jgi:hypothetical protein
MKISHREWESYWVLFSALIAAFGACPLPSSLSEDQSSPLLPPYSRTYWYYVLGYVTSFQPHTDSDLPSLGPISKFLDKNLPDPL